MPTEFDCLDCGRHVNSFWDHREQRKICLICNFIRNQPPEDHEQLREWLYDPPEREYWTKIGSRQ